MNAYIDLYTYSIYSRSIWRHRPASARPQGWSCALLGCTEPLRYKPALMSSEPFLHIPQVERKLCEPWAGPWASTFEVRMQAPDLQHQQAP